MTACKKSAGDVPFGAVRFIEQPQFVKCMDSSLAATLYMDDVNSENPLSSTYACKVKSVSPRHKKSTKVF